MIKAQVMLLPHAADLPTPAFRNEHEPGLDLVAAIPKDAHMVITPGGRQAVPTGLTFVLPPGTEAQIRSRSGLALHFGVTVLNSPGALHADYRGEVHVILANFGREPFAVERGARIAYLVVTPAPAVEWEWPLPADWRSS
jgi:dUTP pyrophosphatase